MTSSTLTQTVSTYGRIKIDITQVSQDLLKNTSVVRVDGTIINASPSSTENHAAKTIACWISGDAGFTGPKFSFDLKHGQSLRFITRTFTVSHDSTGNRTVNFEVKYGVTGVAMFPNNESISNSLDLDLIPRPPSAPGQPQFSNEKPTSLTVTWDAPSDDGGSAITNYILRKYTGTSATGTYISSIGNSLIRNLTDLDPGQTYTFTVVAINGAKIGSGYSPASALATIDTVAGAWIRNGGKWVKAIPYVRTGGIWKQAILYVRASGTWKKTS